MCGKPCPLPVIEAKKQLSSLPSGASFAVLVDNDVARQNLQKLAEGQHHGFRYETNPDGTILAIFTLQDRTDIDGNNSGGLIVAIGSETMGRGNDELGAILMKSFIFSLTEQEELPEAVLFFNSGVRLVCEDSATLDDLLSLAEKGVTINACGACLNFFDLTDKVCVGGITNMFAILETMAQAKRVINL